MNNLTQLQHAIQATIQRELPEISTCQWYPVIRKTIKAPAVLLELADIFPADNVGTGELSLQLRFEARIVMDYRIPESVLATQQLAVQLAALIEANTWGCEVMPAHFLQASSDAFRPELDAYSVWVVMWQQEGRFKFANNDNNAKDDKLEPSPHNVRVGIDIRN